MYLSWNVKETADQKTKQRYGSPYPWPLSLILPYLKQREAVSYLKAHNSWHDFLPDQVILQACIQYYDALKVIKGHLGPTHTFSCGDFLHLMSCGNIEDWSRVDHTRGRGIVKEKSHFVGVSCKITLFI